jgi:tRNA A-37 threonylcarbamoyl transferase component Bud32
MEPASVTVAGFRWLAAPEWRDRLLGPNGLRLDEWLANGQARVVKHGPHRTVYHVALPDLDCYVKRNRVMNTRAWLRELVRPAKARIEYDHAQAVAARGVATIVPLAIGCELARKGPGDSYLITRSLEQTEQLDTFLTTMLPTLEPQRQTRLRRSIAAALGTFVAGMHDAGIEHIDLHPGNLLVRLDEKEAIDLFLIDLHAIRFRPPLDWAASRANLVILNHWFSMRATRSDRLRFWRAYCDARHCVDVFPFPLSVVRRTLPSVVEKLTWESNLRFWRSRDRRCLGTNKYFRRVQSGTVRGHAVRDLPPDVLGALLANPDAPFAWSGVKLLKDSRSSTVAEFDIPQNGDMRRVIYKRFRVTAWSDPWLSLVRRSPALRSWLHGHGLRERCLPTPRPLAVFHAYRRGLACEGYLLTEKVADAVDLHGYVAGLDPLSTIDRSASLHSRIEQVARLVRELHRRRLSHRDLKASNILVSGTEQLSLIDLVGVARYQTLVRERRVKDLARLNASFHQSAALTRTDRLRFLRVYLQWGLFGRYGWKRWWRHIEIATAAKAARNARKGRVLA